MPELFEILMIVCFGISWPLNLVKSYRAGTTKGISLAFYLLIFCGYIAGITSKLINADYMAHFSEKWYVLVVYLINTVSVILNIVVYFRNRARERKSQAAATV